MSIVLLLVPLLMITLPLRRTALRMTGAGGRGAEPLGGAVESSGAAAADGAPAGSGCGPLGGCVGVGNGASCGCGVGTGCVKAGGGGCVGTCAGCSTADEGIVGGMVVVGNPGGTEGVIGVGACGWMCPCRAVMAAFKLFIDWNRVWNISITCCCVSSFIVVTVGTIPTVGFGTA